MGVIQQPGHDGELVKLPIIRFHHEPSPFDRIVRRLEARGHSQTVAHHIAARLLNPRYARACHEVGHQFLKRCVSEDVHFHLYQAAAFNG